MSGRIEKILNYFGYYKREVDDYTLEMSPEYGRWIDNVLKSDLFDPPPPLNWMKKKKLIGYNCKVCRGANFIESGDVVTHICSGFAKPVYE